MLTLAMVVLGLFSLGSLKIDLLPHIIYPSVAVRINDPGVPAEIMEDEVTRQLEEQLAITEDAIHIRSATREGRSAVDLDFAYGKDIDAALRDASTRLDRARRFLPDGIEPPVIYKRDPSQLPAAEYAISSSRLDPVRLREWVDYTLDKWLVNIPGVAAAEVAGGLRREIRILADQDELAARGLDILDIEALLEEENRNVAGGRLRLPTTEIAVQTRGRLRQLEAIERLPLDIEDSERRTVTLALGEIARILDSHEEPRLQIRLNELPAIKLSIQKQPQANTVAVVDAVNQRLLDLEAQGLVPEEVEITPVNDEARHIRHALRNAMTAAASGALLAMLVVWLFLGSLRRTLVIGSAIPIAILVTIILMAAGGLTLNIMTLGGLALGVGMLVDSTIVMLENIHRHQRQGEDPLTASSRAAGEVTSAIVAATSTNLAAVLPFLFIGGLIGLLFNELIVTISAAIVAALAVALTLVPALAARIPVGREGRFRRAVNRGMASLQNAYAWLLQRLLKVSWLVIALFIAMLVWTAPALLKPLASFLPKIDDGRVGIYLTADRGVSVQEMDRITRRVEALVLAQPEVQSVFATVGGFVFGRSRYETANRANLQIQLEPANQRAPMGDWIAHMRQQIRQEAMAGVRIHIRQRGIRGLRLGRGDDDVTFNVQGPDLAVLEKIGMRIADALKEVPGLRNIKRSNEDLSMQLAIDIDREKARALGLDSRTVGKAVRYALEGQRVGRFIAGDRSIDIRLRIEPGSDFPPRLEQLILMAGPEGRTPVRLGQIASITLSEAPGTILREQQQRIVEVTATVEEGVNQSAVIAAAQQRLGKLALPEGYLLYEGGSLKTLQQGQETGYRLLALALFLVLVVMAVQYESLRNPLVILFSVAFSLIGVSLGLEWTDTPLSMPVWLGLVMLAGIVVNN
ncbi:MAG TPA: efflux RND transporter permease subunit, partial [Chromatiaceae bacterium]|nr:efflux RND transporter permease subunit [Chromatiaceae bacterium]